MSQMEQTNGSNQTGSNQAGSQSGNDQAAQQLQRGYSVRQVTNYQASWTEQARGQNGKLPVQLVLDNGVEEYILDTTADDLDVLLSLLKRSHHTMFDCDRKILMFSNLDAD
jgi:hypothetical protein